MSTPLNEEAPDSAVSADQKITVYETPARDYPQHGSVSISLNHSKRQSTTIQIAKSTAESLRDQLNAMLAVPADTVNSADDLEVGSLIKDDTGQLFWKAWRTGGPSLHWLDDEGQPATPAFPATVLYRPEVKP